MKRYERLPQKEDNADLRAWTAIQPGRLSITSKRRITYNIGLPAWESFGRAGNGRRGKRMWHAAEAAAEEAAVSAAAEAGAAAATETAASWNPEGASGGEAMNVDV